MLPEGDLKREGVVEVAEGLLPKGNFRERGRRGVVEGGKRGRDPSFSPLHLPHTSLLLPSRCHQLAD